MEVPDKKRKGLLFCWVTQIILALLILKRLYQVLVINSHTLDTNLMSEIIIKTPQKHLFLFLQIFQIFQFFNFFLYFLGLRRPLLGVLVRTILGVAWIILRPRIDSDKSEKDAQLGICLADSTYQTEFLIEGTIQQTLQTDPQMTGPLTEDWRCSKVLPEIHTVCTK